MLPCDWDCKRDRDWGADGAGLCGVYVFFPDGEVLPFGFASPLVWPLLLLYRALVSGLSAGICITSPESMRGIGATCLRYGMVGGRFLYKE